MSARTRNLALLGAALALTIVLATTASAFAAPEPTLGLTALQTLLTASPSGTVDGYFKTVVKGSAIVDIPVTIESITAGQRSGTSLILFEATGPLMAKYGGIVAGMSGSPVYVHDCGVDKIVGAVSYGDYFTLGGTGLATPIESMLALESHHAPAVMPLRTAAISSGKLIDRVIVSDDPQDFAGAEHDGAFVAKPLSSVFIGGLRPGGSAYKALAAALAKHDVKIVALDTPLAGTSAADDAEFATPLVPGAAVATLASRGDLWVGGIGTVTYTDGSSVLAFGHPAFWSGTTSLYMANAWIDGIWPSSYEPYKLGSPGATRGQFTQDRFAGILGTLNDFPAETTITAHATDADTGESVNTHVYIPRLLMNTGQWDSGIAVAAVSVAYERLEDAQAIDGSAITTTTARVSDGIREYTITIPNRYDSSDVGSDGSTDVRDIVDELQGVLSSGTQTLDIESIDLQTSVSAHHRSATVVGVSVDGGLRSGVNTATVTYFVYGEPAYLTRKVAFTIPAGMGLQGTLTAMSTKYALENSNPGEGDVTSTVTTPGPVTDRIWMVSDAVSDLNATLPNSALQLQYTTANPDSAETPTDASATVTATDITPWYLDGVATADSPVMSAELSRSTVNYRGATVLSGEIIGPTADSTVRIYGRVAGESTERLLDTVTATYNTAADTSTYYSLISGLPANTKLRVHIDPADGWLSSDAFCRLKVRAKAQVNASTTTFAVGKTITLSAKVLSPASAGSKLRFQRWNAHTHAWLTISTETLVASSGAARASTTWQPGRGTHKVRVRFLGGPANAAASSNTIVLHVR